MNISFLMLVNPVKFHDFSLSVFIKILTPLHRPVAEDFPKPKAFDQLALLLGHAQLHQTGADHRDRWEIVPQLYSSLFCELLPGFRVPCRHVRPEVVNYKTQIMSGCRYREQLLILLIYLSIYFERQNDLI